MFWLITVAITLFVSVAMIYINKLFFEDHTNYLKKQVDEIRREAKTKKQRKHREILVSSFIQGVRGSYTSRLILLIGYVISLLLLISVEIIAVGVLIINAISSTSLIGKEYTSGIRKATQL